MNLPLEPKLKIGVQTIHRRTELRVYGNADSEGSYGQVVKQGFYVIWTMPGDVRVHDLDPNKIWSFDDVEILDQPFGTDTHL